MIARRVISRSLLGAAVLVGAAAAGSPPAGQRLPSLAVELSEEDLRVLYSHSPRPALPVDETNAVADDPAAARLGQFLFFDTRLSAAGARALEASAAVLGSTPGGAADAVSCATCHHPDQAFTDGKHVATGIGALERNTMSLLDVAYNRWFFWDGRADTLWAQTLQPMEHPLEQGGNRVAMARLVWRDPGLRAAYEAVFGPLPDLSDPRRFPANARPVPDEPDDPLQRAWAAMSAEDRGAIDRVFTNLGKAIAAYERRLVTPPSDFDVFVEGVRTGDDAKVARLSPAAQRGWKLFAGRANCRLCHFGPSFTDGEFHSTGVPPAGGGPLRDAGRYEGAAKVVANPFNAAGPYSAAPDGASADKVRSLLRSPETWGQFKTPSLRNVTRTAPYMHQGQFETLEQVLHHYSTLEDAVLPGHHRELLLVPINLTPDEIADLVAFLGSLTGGDLPPELLRAPAEPGLGPSPRSSNERNRPGGGAE